jgi:hypothetical protein
MIIRFIISLEHFRAKTQPPRVDKEIFKKLEAYSFFVFLSFVFPFAVVVNWRIINCIDIDFLHQII